MIKTKDTNRIEQFTEKAFLIARNKKTEYKKLKETNPMKKITRLIEARLGTGLWGASTAEHTKTFIREAINSVRNSAKTLETTVITVSNEQINVLVKGTEKQINALAQKIRNCVITIDDIKIVDQNS